ncbi:MAG: hypothetical protein JXB39_12115 [Deltaproteobacteria bacterium]|nr:hypothetical protein [Deltaproteobacteria bacterium]
MSVLQRFANVARGWVRARLHPDPDATAAQAALEAELAGPGPRQVRYGVPEDRIVPDPDATTEADVPRETGIEPPGPADGNVKRTL